MAGVLGQFRGARALISPLEHKSVTLAAPKAVSLPVNHVGRLDLTALSRQITDDTVLISVSYASGEIGTIQPLRRIAEIVERVRRYRQKQGIKLPLYLHSDATAAANCLDLHVSHLGVDLMTISGAKIYGLKQTGVLYARAGVAIKPIVVGGGQERGRRGGTENVPGIIGLATALDKAQRYHAREARRLSDLRAIFVTELTHKAPSLTIIGNKRYCLPSHISGYVRGIDGERLVMELDRRGVMASTGAACLANSGEVSRSLLAIGLSEAEANGSLRLTMGRFTTKTKVKRAAAIIGEAVKTTSIYFS